jgi:hypothetical protein
LSARSVETRLEVTEEIVTCEQFEDEPFAVRDRS